jgi:hypothetical protein
MTWLALFTTSAELSGTQRLILMLPLCLSVAIIYKTTRLENMRDVPGAAAVLWVTIVLSMCAVGVGLWAIFSIMV